MIKSKFMKHRLTFYGLLLVFLSACNGIQTTGQSECEQEMAKAILWVDRTGNESLQKYGFIRTAKVRANVYSDGTFRIMPKAIPGKEGINKKYVLYSIADSTPTLAEWDFNTDNSKWNFRNH